MSISIAAAAIIGSLLAAGVSAGSTMYAANTSKNQAEIEREWQTAMAREQMDFQTSANQAAMNFSAAEAEKQRNWSAQMANTEMQRRVADLKAAGLNPALAYMHGGSGASTPGASSAQGVSSSGASVGSVSNNAGTILAKLGVNAINSATSVYQTYAALVKAGAIE